MFRSLAKHVFIAGCRPLVAPDDGFLMTLDQVAQALETGPDKLGEVIDRWSARSISSRQDGKSSFRVRNVDRKSGDCLLLSQREDDAVRHNGQGVGRFEVIDDAHKRAAGVAY